jgi:hypothetical protein
MAAAGGEDDGPPDASLLLHQNRQMAHRLDQMREEKLSLQGVIERLEGSQRSYDTHLATVDRHWLGMDTSLRALLARADLASPPPPAPAADPASSSSSFLGRLLQRAPVDTTVNSDEVDAELTKRSQFSAELLAQVGLSLLDVLSPLPRPRAIHISSHGELRRRGLGGPWCVAAAAAAAVAQLAAALQTKEAAAGGGADAAQLRAQLDGSQAQHQAALARAATAETSLGLLQQQLRELGERFGGACAPDKAQRRVADSAGG